MFRTESTHPRAPLGTVERWFSVGASKCTNSQLAVREAVTHALQSAADPTSAKLAIVFTSGEHCNTALTGQLDELLPGVMVVGCSTAGEIAVAGQTADASDANVVIALLGGNSLRIKTTFGSMREPALLRESAAVAAQIVDAVEDCDYQTLLSLTDGLSRSDQCDVVRGAYETAGATIPLVGGCAGDNMLMRQTFQLHGRDVLTDSFVMAAIGSDSPIGVGVAHGWRSVGNPMFVTAVDGTQVLELDNRPALDVYLERLGQDPALGEDADAFTSFAVTHPLALVRRRGDEIRWVNGLDMDRRSLKCNVEMQRNTQVWLTEGDCKSTVDAVSVACAQAIDQLHDHQPIGAIAFDCAARRAVLGETGLANEVAEISRNLGGVPVAGFYTYGEFARVRGPNGFHNQTLVMLVFS